MATNLVPRCSAVSSLQLRSRAIISLGATREFSSTATRCDESAAGSPKPPSKAGLDQTARRHNTRTLLRNVFQKSDESSAKGSSLRPRNFQPSSRPIDARSLGANVPAPDPNQPVIRRVSMNFPGGAAPRNMNNRLLLAANALSRKKRGKPGQGANKRKPDTRRRRRMDTSAFDEDEVDTSVKEYELEKQEKARRSAERYNPEPYTVDKLKATWPSLPMGEGNNAVANSETVMEKLNWMGDRYVGSYEPPQELAKRMYEGKRVMFKNDEEKAEVLEIVQKMVAERAQKLTERKGQVVPPEDASFEALGDQEKKGLVDTLVQGKYDQPLVDEKKTGTSPIVAHVLKNLTNNGTYQGAQAEKFLEKFVKTLPPRLKGQKPAAA